MGKFKGVPKKYQEAFKRYGVEAFEAWAVDAATEWDLLTEYEREHVAYCLDLTLRAFDKLEARYRGGCYGV